MSRRERIESGRRLAPVAWLDPVAATPIEVAAGGLILVVLGLLGMVWGAAVGSAWWVNREFPDVGVSDAAVAMAHFGANRFEWDGAWPAEIEETLAGQGWFWAVFAVEALVLALLFWPAWRLLGPRAADPGVVMITPTPAVHPRAAKRQAAREARVAEQAERRRTRLLTPVMADAPPPTLAPTVDKLLVPRSNGQQVVLGQRSSKLVATIGFDSVLVFGPTRSGKTSAFTVPALLDWQGPALVVTAKSDVVSLTWQPRAERGRAWLFDPMAAMAGAEASDDEHSGLRRGSSHGWSPLHMIDDVPRARNEPELDQRVQQWGRARRTAQWMVSAARIGHGRGEMPEPWFVVAEQLLAPMLLAAAADELPIGQVAEWVDRREIDEVDVALERLGVPEARAAWQGSHNHDPATMAGTYQILALIMFPYGDPRVLNQARRDDRIDARRLLDGGANTLYVLSPANHQQRLRPLMTTLVSEVLDSAIGQAAGSPGGRLRTPLLVVLDDAAGCAPFDLLDELAAVGAGLGIQILSLFQDLGHVERTFGADNALALANAHRARVVLPGVADGATLSHVNALIRGSRLVGSTASDDPDLEGRAGEIPGAPTWLRTLDDGKALCVYGNLPPLQMTLRPWFGDADLRAMVEPAAPTPPPWWRRLFGGGGDSGSSSEGGANPFDSAANDRESDRYWDSVIATGLLPDPRPYDDGSNRPDVT